MIINLTTIKSALVSVVLMAIVQVGVYIISVGDIFKIDAHMLINLGVISLLTGIVSVIKNLLTTDAGNFVGAVKVK